MAFRKTSNGVEHDQPAGTEMEAEITAAHCLPDLPRCHAASLTEDRTYKALLGPLGRKPTVWAECLSVAELR